MRFFVDVSMNVNISAISINVTLTEHFNAI